MLEIEVKEKSGKQWVSARDLQSKLQLGHKNFSRWIEKNVVEVGFMLNHDFYTLECKTKGRPRKDYMLTTETAKHVALMAKSPIGKKIRDYFIKIHDAYINGQIKQLEINSADRINYLERAVDQRDEYISTIINEAEKIMQKDPIGTESKKTGRPRINLRRACYVSAKKDDPKQLVFGFNL